MHLPIKRLTPGAAVAAIMASLSGCAAPHPMAPTVMALPAEGEDFALFQQHDITCRQYGAAQVGGTTPSAAAGHTALTDAAVGTGLGAAAGAAIGSASGHAGTGAAIGAGAGLLGGGLVGAASGRKAADSVQRSYDMFYSQCMIANGDRIPEPKPTTTVVYQAVPAYAPRVVYAPPPPVVYSPPPAVVYAPPPAPVVVVPPPR